MSEETWDPGDAPPGADGADALAAARLATIRSEFDRAFAAAPAGPREGGTDVVVVHAGAERFALSLEALQGIHHVERVVPLPGGPPALRGLAGVHGRLVAVFDLARLLGRPAAEGGWVALLAGGGAVGLAFDGLVGVRRVAPGAILAAEGLASGALIAAAIDATALDGEAAGGDPPVGMIDVAAVRAALGLAGPEDDGSQAKGAG